MLIPGITSHIVAGAAAYEPEAVTFDGSNDHFTRSSLTGVSDGKQFTFSLWVRPNGSGQQWWLYNEVSGLRGAIYHYGSDRCRLYWENTSGTKILDLHTGNASIGTGAWYHVMGSVDLSDTGKRHLYLNGVDALNVTTYTNQNMDLTPTQWRIGAKVTNLEKLNADMSELWWDDSYFDLSVQANREKFISGTGSGATPVDLGSDGSTPTGTSPAIYFSGAASVWNNASTNNSGAGGGFTVYGAVADSSNEPVEVP